MYRTPLHLTSLLSTSFPLRHSLRSLPKMVTFATQPKPQPAGDQSLPRLPVPPLQDTLAKYLRTVKPLVSPEAFKKTIELVKTFGTDQNLGPKLQALLENRANSMDNWMADWWLQTAYLEYREPVVIFSSPGLIFPLQTFSSLEDQLSYSSKLIHSALTYRDLIRSSSVKQDSMGKVPLDMSQYSKIFGTNRTPSAPRDELRYHSNSGHIVICYKNYFFRLDCYSSNKKLLEPSDLLAQLEWIVQETQGLSGAPVGLLTAEHRDSWAASYTLLKRDNQKTLEEIESALFVLSIDRPNRFFELPEERKSAVKVEDLELSARQTLAALQMLHGNTTNSGNRWFDKTIGFSIGTEGEVGLTYEHSPAEGPPIANLMDFIVSSIKDKGQGQLRSNSTGTFPKPLNFVLDKELTRLVAEAKVHLDALIADVEMSAFTFKGYGREQIKQWGFSPDSFIQMGIQGAFYRLHNVPGAQYESASTRMFRGGRTECIRSCSVESVELGKALKDVGKSAQDKFEVLKRAVEGHKKYAGEAVRGQGVDRHLLGLKKIAMENGMQLPELFKDEGFTKSSHFRLSTSQVPSLFEAFMCYGPLVPDGYGCCYNPLKESIVFGLSSFNKDKSTCAHKFKRALIETLLEMEKVALASTLKSKL